MPQCIEYSVRLSDKNDLCCEYGETAGRKAEKQNKLGKKGRTKPHGEKEQNERNRGKKNCQPDELSKR